MNSDSLKKYAAALVVMVLCFLAGMYSAPKSVKEQTAVRENQSTTQTHEVTETTKETRLPDGTVIIEKRKENETKTETKKDKEATSSRTVDVRPSYRAGVLYKPSIKGLQTDTYTVILEKRLFSEVYLGIAGSSDRTVGITLSVGF